MSDSIATSVAYMALRHAGMPLPKRLVVHFSGGELATMTNPNSDGEGEIHELHEGDVRDLLTMHALRWLSSLKDVKVEATFYSADEAYLEVFVDGEYLFFDDYNQDLLWAICNAAKAWKAEQPVIETTKGE